MKITQLLDDELEQLDEHLGNLDAIDKELLSRALQKKVDKDQFTGSRSWVDTTESDRQKARYNDLRVSDKKLQLPSEVRVTNGIVSKLGRESKLVHMSVSYKEALKLLTEDENYASIIIMYEDKQALIINATFIDRSRKTKTLGYKEKNSFSWAVTKDFARKAEKNDRQAGIYVPPPLKSVSDYLKSETKIDLAKSKGAIESEAAVGRLFKAFAMFELIKSDPELIKFPPDKDLPKINIIGVTVDTERAHKKETRAAEKKSIQPVISSPDYLFFDGKYGGKRVHVYDNYLKSLKDSLAYRLNKLKISKAISVETLEQMLNEIKAKGYLDKINFMGKGYKLGRSNFDFDDLMRKGQSLGNSYIEYTREESNDSDNEAAYYKEMSEIRAKLMAEAPGDDDDEKKEWVHEKALDIKPQIRLKYRIAPSTIKITLVLNGSSIEPFKITGSEY